MSAITEMDMATCIEVYFYLEGNRYAYRFTPHVPSVGDEVRFKGIAYKVVYRIWTYDEENPMAKLEIEPVDKENNK